MFHKKISFPLFDNIRLDNNYFLVINMKNIDLCLQDGYFLCHKLILAASNSFFKEILQSLDAEEPAFVLMLDYQVCILPLSRKVLFLRFEIVNGSIYLCFDYNNNEISWWFQTLDVQKDYKISCKIFSSTHLEFEKKSSRIRRFQNNHI